MILFNYKTVPILTYVLELKWEKLSEEGLTTQEKVKTKYLKTLSYSTNFTEGSHTLILF